MNLTPVSASLAGMQPDIWGPPLWFFLHCISLNYPMKPTREQARQYLEFFQALGNVLPCRACRESYAAWTRDLNLNVFVSRASLARWVYDLHNTVNVKLNKPISVSFGQMVHTYESFRAGNPRQRSRVVLAKNS